MLQIYHTQYLYLNNIFSTITAMAMMTTTMLVVATAISGGGGGAAAAEDNDGDDDDDDMCNMASRLYKFYSGHLVTYFSQC
jgi:hypothetical protein